MHWMIVVLTLLIPHPMSMGDEKGLTEYVGIDISQKQKEFRSGESGYFLITFKPKKGIQITTDPPFRVSFDSMKEFFSPGKAEFSQDGKGYVNPQKVVRQHIAIAKTTPPGSYTLTAKLIYYYCSDQEGWCSRFNQPIELTLTVVK